MNAKGVFFARTLPTSVGKPWIGHSINPKDALIFAQNARSMRTYSSIRQECCKIASHDAATPIALDTLPCPSGRNCSRHKRATAGYSIKQGFSDGAKRSDITTPTRDRPKSRWLKWRH